MHLRGGDQQRNAAITEGILNGERGAHRDIVLLNGAAALVVAGRTSSLREGALIAAEAIDSGRALGVLQRLRTETAGVAA